MRSLKSLLAAAVAVGAVAIGAFVVPASGTAATTPDPFSAVRTPSEIRSNFVGLVDRVPLGIQVTISGDVVAYWCDGTGKVSVWFTGKQASKSTQLQLKSADGSTIEFDTKKLTGTVTRQGKKTGFSLAVAQANAGIYRSTITAGDQRSVTGWVLTNDGYLSGQVTVNNQVAGSLFETPTSPGQIVSPTGAVPTTTIPVAVMSLGCKAKSIRAIWTEIRIIKPSTEKANELWDQWVAAGCGQLASTT